MGVIEGVKRVNGTDKRTQQGEEARISGRPGIPPFQGGKVLSGLVCDGKLPLVSLLQVVKRTINNTPHLTIPTSKHEKNVQRRVLYS